jgi:hypothetical protein
MHLKNLSKDVCQNIIKHTERLMDKWLKSDATERDQCTDLDVPEDALMTGDASEQ